MSSDRLRAVVGVGEDDVAASTDAFALLEQIVAKRLARRLTTVIDTLGLDETKRRNWLRLAREAGLPCIAVAFDVPAAQCRERNRGRTKRIPAAVLTQQVKSWPAVRDGLPTEGFDRVITAGESVRVVPESFVTASQAAERQQERPEVLRFGLHIGRFVFDANIADELAAIVAAAESAGFDSIYVMDHFRQIPQLGRPWEDFLESYTTLAWLAARTERVALGALVTGITYRNVAHLGKIVATLDVPAAGARCVGSGWPGSRPSIVRTAGISRRCRNGTRCWRMCCRCCGAGLSGVSWPGARCAGDGLLSATDSVANSDCRRR